MKLGVLRPDAFAFECHPFKGHTKSMRNNMSDSQLFVIFKNVNRQDIP